MMKISNDGNKDDQPGDQGGIPAPPADLLFQRPDGRGRGRRRSSVRLKLRVLFLAFRAFPQVLFDQRPGFRLGHIFRKQGKKIPDCGTGQFHDSTSISSFSLARAR